ncbi:MAG: 6-bladed beta-propeller, partial [Tannerellaceae bacterium]|nr:6-bladed beta-propeller [Tannerellaceae bacterium]
MDSAKAKFLHIHSANHFSRAFGSENGVYFFMMFEDVIHQWTNDKLRPAFRVNINQRNIPPSFYRNDYADVSVFFQALFRENYAYGTGLFLDYGKDFLYAYFYGGECHFALISGESREATLDFKSIREDVALSGYPINLTKQSYFIQDNNELILPLIPADIIDY